MKDTAIAIVAGCIVIPVVAVAIFSLGAIGWAMPWIIGAVALGALGELVRRNSKDD